MMLRVFVNLSLTFDIISHQQVLSHIIADICFMSGKMPCKMLFWDINRSKIFALGCKDKTSCIHKFLSDLINY